MRNTCDYLSLWLAVVCREALLSLCWYVWRADTVLSLLLARYVMLGVLTELIITSPQDKVLRKDFLNLVESALYRMGFMALYKMKINIIHS